MCSVITITKKRIACLLAFKKNKTKQQKQRKEGRKRGEEKEEKEKSFFE
jgi:hypothetical protein